MEVTMNELRLATLKGEFLTYVARGEASISLETLRKTTDTYLRREHISESDLTALLAQTEEIGVAQFKERKTHPDRVSRFQELCKTLAGFERTSTLAAGL